MDSNRSSRTLSASTSTMTLTPTTSRRSSITARNTNRPSPPLPTAPPGPMPVTTLSTKSWRKAYPRIGQFAMTESQEVVAAGPRGLFYFKRVQDHVSKPWSKARLLPSTPAMLDNSSVSGLAIHSSEQRLDIYCVSRGVLHCFYRSAKPGSSFVVNPRPPFSTHAVSGTPAIIVATTLDSPERLHLVVPCQLGGLLHTSTTELSSSSSYISKWSSVNHVAKHLGVISAVSITTVHTGGRYRSRETVIVAACIITARLHILEGLFERTPTYHSSSCDWETQPSTRIPHPGEVTGNPVLINTGSRINQLDLLVPSAEGGVFHFVRTASTPDEWHMIARITFPPSLPLASCLALNFHTSYERKEFEALVQSGGQIYQVKTYEGTNPWSGSYLIPIVAPGPFSD
ncbi:hypothetical protein F4680DRAFT_469150 [Xylaria scruposa]|nr:hypothetical protein F4680DRAFT_469150 [Xylaria scruposa]